MNVDDSLKKGGGGSFVTQHNPCATVASLTLLCGPIASTVKQRSNKHSQMFVPSGQLHWFVRTAVCLSVRTGDIYPQLWICAKIYIWNEPTDSIFD